MAARRTSKPAPDEAPVETITEDHESTEDAGPEQDEAPGLTATQQAYAAALAREREGYVRRRLDGRVAEVDAELKRMGAGRGNGVRGQERAVLPPSERA